jgi:hypothetical protein
MCLLNCSSTVQARTSEVVVAARKVSKNRVKVAAIPSKQVRCAQEDTVLCWGWKSLSLFRGGTHQVSCTQYRIDVSWSCEHRNERSTTIVCWWRLWCAFVCDVRVQSLISYGEVFASSLGCVEIALDGQADAAAANSNAKQLSELID